MNGTIRDLIIAIAITAGLVATVEFVRGIGAPPAPADTPPPIPPLPANGPPLIDLYGFATDSRSHLPMTSGVYFEPHTHLYLEPRRQ